ncbi:MAG: hypothetical protein K8I60_03725 [Anaerolineae bacterium]|nr:hypothetical protein [Anaerolineae bacterium]
MIEMPRRVCFEMHQDGGVEPDACDVIVEMESGKMFTALFVTMPYLKRQMELSYAVSKQLPDTQPVRYAVLETPHILVDVLDKDTIEDTIDNLLALDVFEGLFTLVTEDGDTDTTTRTTMNGKRATAEVAAVVLSDVLVVDEES